MNARTPLQLRSEEPSAGRHAPSSPRTPIDPSDSLEQYLREICAYRVLRREVEAVLARRIAAGDQEALDELVRANLRFVVSVAKKYQHLGLPLADLVNEGNLGLMRAARRFDETKGIKFISYAVWWIRQTIARALADQGRIVRVPVSRARTVYRVGRRLGTLEQTLGREATVAEIADGTALTRDAVARVLAIARPHVSLDAPHTPDGEGALVESLADDAAPPPDAPVIEQGLTSAIEAALGTLRPREARVLRLYFGFDPEEPMTLEQIGHVLGITRERVRQIKDHALARLRHTRGRRELEAFVR
jgi:RNA polymerase primary sigma factor